MKNEKPKTIPIGAILDVMAGVLFIFAAFHILTSEQGIDYTFILIGLVFLAAGIIGIIRRP